MRLLGARRWRAVAGVLLWAVAAGGARAAESADAGGIGSSAGAGRTDFLTAGDLGPSIRTVSCSTAAFLDLEAVLPGALRQALEQVPSQGARAAARFVAGHPGHLLRIAVSSLDREYYWPADIINRGSLMSFSSRLRGFKLNHRCLHLGGRDEAALLREHEALSGFIEALLPIFVHEVSHARVAEAFPFRIPHFVEDETVGFYREMLFLVDALAHDPGFMGLREAFALNQTMLGHLQGVKALSAQVTALSRSQERDAGFDEKLEAAQKRFKELEEIVSRIRPEYERRVTDLESTVFLDLASFIPSNPVFEGSIRRHYADTGSVFADARQMLAAAREELRQCEELLAFARALAGRPGLPAAERAKAEHDEAAMVQKKEEAREDMRFWSDPVRVSRARAYFTSLLSGLRAEADLRRRRQRAVLRRYRGEPGLSAPSPSP